MKNNIHTLLLLFALIFSFSHAIKLNDKLYVKKTDLTEVEYSRNFFIGEWTVKGYVCVDHPGRIIELITIKYENDEFVGIKVNGDKCVRSGHETFRGKIPTKIISMRKIPIGKLF
jgi:hypothetical protein